MKKIIKIGYICLIGGLLIFSCRTSDDLLTLNETLPSTIDEVAVSDFVLQEPAANANPMLLTVTWTETQFKLSNDASHPEPGGPVNYLVQMDKAGNDFAAPEVVASTNGLSSDLFIKDINAIILAKLGAIPEIENAVELRIMANYGTSQSVASTNILKLNITPFKPVVAVEPIYLTGDMNGWDNTNTEFLMFRDSNLTEDRTYTYTGKLAANTYFKFTPKESLGTYRSYCRKDDTTLVYEESEGGAFFNEFERYVTITINTQTLAYTIVDYTGPNIDKFYNTMGPIGNFCNWDNEPLMNKSTYDGHQWNGTFTFDVATACKFRGNRDWANNWGGADTEFPYGKAVVDGPGANLTVTGQYRIYFNDLTNHFAILPQ